MIAIGKMALNAIAAAAAILLLLSVAARPVQGASGWRWPRFLLEMPDPPFIPAWSSLPWGPSPDWGLIEHTLECRLDMRAQMAAVTRPCDKEPDQPACKLRIKLVGLHAHDYTRNEGGRFDFAKQTAELKEKYCRRWGSCESLILTDPTFAEHHKATERHPSWHKVLAVKEEVAKGDFDWYMWLDGDAAFVDPNIDLRFLIARWTMPEYGGDPTKIFLVSRDIWYTPGDGASNMGVWIIKKGEESVNFLQELWEVPDKVSALSDAKQGHPWEQRCFNEHMYAKHAGKIERLNECWLFGHPLSLIDQPFITHLCGVANAYKQQERLRYFSFWNDRIKA